MLPFNLIDMPEPDIRLDEFRLWIDRIDSYGLSGTVFCRSNCAIVWIGRAHLLNNVFVRWVDECETLYKTLSGETHLNHSPATSAVDIRLSAIGKTGHIRMETKLTANFYRGEHHVFVEEFDQTYLISFLEDCKRVREKIDVAKQYNAQ